MRLLALAMITFWTPVLASMSWAYDGRTFSIAVFIAGGWSFRKVYREF